MKYIDAEKLIEILEEKKKAEYENCGGVNSKTGVLQEVQELITSLQLEQPEIDWEKEIDKTCYKCIQSIDNFDLDRFARHFYELGLYTRKEE